MRAWTFPAQRDTDLETLYVKIFLDIQIILTILNRCLHLSRFTWDRVTWDLVADEDSRHEKEDPRPSSCQSQAGRSTVFNDRSVRTVRYFKGDFIPMGAGRTDLDATPRLEKLAAVY